MRKFCVHEQVIHRPTMREHTVVVRCLASKKDAEKLAKRMSKVLRGNRDSYFYVHTRG